MMYPSANSKPANPGPPSGGNWFFGLAMSDEVRSALVRAQEMLRSAADAAGARCAWVHPEDFHITVVFIGPWRAERAEELARAARAAAARGAPFDVQVGGVGFFGPPRSPRVLWAGVDTPPALAGIRANCLEALAASGITPDRQPYRPHVTLARVRSRPREPSLTDALQRHQNVRFGFVSVRDLRVMRGVPNARGPRYRTEWMAPFSGE